MVQLSHAYILLGGEASWERRLESLARGQIEKVLDKSLLSGFLGAMAFVHTKCFWEKSGDRATEPVTQSELKRTTALHWTEQRIFSGGCFHFYSFPDSAAEGQPHSPIEIFWVVMTPFLAVHISCLLLQSPRLCELPLWEVFCIIFGIFLFFKPHKSVRKNGGEKKDDAYDTGIIFIYISWRKDA